MKIIGPDEYSLTQEEKTLLEKVNEFELKLDDRHVIRFKDLLDNVIVCLDGKRDREKKLPFSEPELLEAKKQLEAYLKRGDNASNETDKEGKATQFAALFKDLENGIIIKREEQIVVPIFCPDDGSEPCEDQESWKSRLEKLETLINGAKTRDVDNPDEVTSKSVFDQSEKDITEKFSLSETELSEAKKQLETYLKRGDKASEETDNAKKAKLVDKLFNDLENGIIIKREKQIVVPVFYPSDDSEHTEKWEKWKSRLTNLKTSIDRATLFDMDCFEKISLKGLFTPSEMKVTLFMENMARGIDGKRKKEDVVYVFVHEMLHAYYYCCLNTPGNSVREIEECMAEFGALCFLEQLLNMTTRKFKNAFKEVFNHAEKQIEAKRFNIGDLAAYGFGKYVFDNCHDKKAWMLAYSKKSLLLDTDMHDVAEYVKYVYPFYPDKESECFKCLKRVLFDDNRPRYVFEHFNDFRDVALRILLVDDKVGVNTEDCSCKVHEDNNCSCKVHEYKEITQLQELQVKLCKLEDCAKYNCKLCTVKRLMDDSGNGDGKNIVFRGLGSTSDYYYWKESGIECYYCPTVIKDFIDSDSVILSRHEEISVKDKKSSKRNSGSNTTLEISCDFQPLIDSKNNNVIRKSIDKVQIVGVRDVRTALLLLSRYKFDMLFIDYLLDKKEGGNNENGREYSIQFFEFLSTDYDKKAKEEKDEEKKKKYQLLDKLRRAVLDNRGPLDKLWIMPITGFNSPFIQTLQNKNVPLISTRWHIENGADPITTPWQFLVKLNQFIELQLKGCVYNIEQLISFLTFSGANLKRAYPYKEKYPYKKNTYLRRKLYRNYNPPMPDCRFHEFQAFMGAEFSNFISHFGARPVIRRDAMIEGEDITNKSVFSTYVWNKFYTGDDSNKNDKEALFALHNLMQIFYQVAATMPEDRNGVLRLRESFRRLRYYIEKHDLYIQNETDSDKEKLDETLSFIAGCIDVLLEEKPDRKEVETGK